MPLASRTTLGVGGDARLYAEARDPEEVRRALALADERGLPVFVLGGGSNLVVADRGLEALVLRVRMTGVAMEPVGDGVLVRAGAGVGWDELVASAVERGLAGLECLSGIPGEVGACPIQNVGAYGQEVAESIRRVHGIDRRTGEAVAIDAEACAFGYRDSAFKGSLRDRFVLTEVELELRPGAPPAVRYPELRARLGEGFASANLASVREAVLALRRGKSMLLDPADENGRSAGSFFTNPCLEPEAFAEAKRRVEASGVVAPGEAMPSYAAAGGQTKLSAAWLIERAGLSRGTRDGAVGLSTRHTLAIVTRPGATAADVVRFARRVRLAVLDRFGVSLTPEPTLVGFQGDELEGLLERTSGALLGGTKRN